MSPYWPETGGPEIPQVLEEQKYLEVLGYRERKAWHQEAQAGMIVQKGASLIRYWLPANPTPAEASQVQR